MSQNKNILKFLNSNKMLSVKQAESLYGVKNLRARISEIRRMQPVQIVTTKNSRGFTAYKFSENSA